MHSSLAFLAQNLHYMSFYCDFESSRYLELWQRGSVYAFLIKCRYSYRVSCFCACDLRPLDNANELMACFYTDFNGFIDLPDHGCQHMVGFRITSRTIAHFIRNLELLLLFTIPALWQARIVDIRDWYLLLSVRSIDDSRSSRYKTRENG